MSTHTLENERLRVTVDDAGAELISVYDKQRRAERIWTANPEIWNRHAPILFPFVGKVVDGRYRIGEREYAMKTQHGFARDMKFTCLEENADSIAHCLSDTEATRACYPYAFTLTVTHRLAGNRLTVAWTIENPGSEVMYFSIGGHPGFIIPEGVRKEDCQIVFPGMKSLHYIGANSEGFALPVQKTLSLVNGCTRYQDDIPGTWIFEDGQVKQVGIAGPDGAPFVMMDCAQFPMLAVWANRGGPFICLEPWFGRTDDAGFTGTVDQKKAMQKLEPGEVREISYSMDFEG